MRNSTRPGSGQEMKGDKKRCYRHQDIYPDETVWREQDEFWVDNNAPTGRQSRCSRCVKMIRHHSMGYDYAKSKVPYDESQEIHARVHEDTKAMIDRLRDTQQRSLSAIVEDACRTYALSEIRKQIGVAS